MEILEVEDQEPPNHSPPKNTLDLINNNYIETSFKQESSNYIPQMPFEDEYSQLVPYDD